MDNSDNSDAANALPSMAARPFVEQLAAQLNAVASFAVRNADAQEVSGLFTLLGTQESARFNAHHALPCTAPSTSAETCMPYGIGPETRELMACFTSGCESADTLFTEVYTTVDGHLQPSDRIAISYSTVQPYPAGTVTYDPNPWVRWRIDTSMPGAIDVKAKLEASVFVQLDDQEIDLSYDGETSGQFMQGKARYSVQVELPRVAVGSIVRLIIESDDVGQHRSTQVVDEKGQILGTASDETLIWSKEVH